jgi:hypothetical protein
MTQQFILECPCDEAVALVTSAFAECGLRVLHSFDLRVAAHRAVRAADLGKQQTTWRVASQTPLAIPADCLCPKHGTADCDCQMVVMLVYGAAASPATLEAHGHDGRTWLSLVDTPEQRSDSILAECIVQSLCRVKAGQLYFNEQL